MIATNEEIFEKLSKQFEELQSNLDCYLNPEEELHSQLIQSTKTVYDVMKSNETLTGKLKKSFAAKTLLTTGFDDEQIWQQLQLYNKHQLRHARNTFKEINSNVDVSLTSSSRENELEMNGTSEDSTDENIEKELDVDKYKDIDDDLISEDEIDEEDIDSEDEEEETFVGKKYKPSVVDDNFFKLRQMEEFLNDQDKLEENKRDRVDAGDSDEELEEEDDMFGEDLPDEDDVQEALMYKEFFDPISKDSKKKTKKKTPRDGDIGQDEEATNFEDVEESDADEENVEVGQEVEAEQEVEVEQEVDNKKTAFERKQEELRLKISKLEDDNISAKPWQLGGETTAKLRPVNSLLEEHVSFDHTSVGAPVVTEETTETIEDLIKQRIRDQAWDDVERKVKPTTQPYEYKKAPQLNMEKSKLSLAEVYEKEYLKEMKDDEEEKENEDHVLVKGLMEKLFVKLDALSNFYFTPKPAKPDIKIITNAPSLQMEEVTPITRTQASQMAPEEIYEKKKGDVVGDGEKTKEDRKRERRQKKIKKKFAVKERERKDALKAKTGGKANKKKAMEQLKKGVRNTIVNEKANAETSKAVKSSSRFFDKLQDEVTKKISSHKSSISDGPSKKKKKKTENFKL